MALKEIRKDLYTKSEYARKIGVDKSTVGKNVKAGKYDTVEINGSILIKDKR